MKNSVENQKEEQKKTKEKRKRRSLNGKGALIRDNWRVVSRAPQTKMEINKFKKKDAQNPVTSKRIGLPTNRFLFLLIFQGGIQKKKKEKKEENNSQPPGSC